MANVDAQREAEILLSHILGRNRAWLFAHADEDVGDELAGRYRELLARRGAGEPIAYLIGHREFRSLDFLVTPDVLIPRAETERLVELALLHIPQSAKVDIADLGTGSGAIALTVARERPDARIIAIDSSAQALQVARANAKALNIGNVDFRHGDWLTNLDGCVFDVIVSNPPYIADGDVHLSQGDLRFEPKQALTAGADGLDAIRRIAADAVTHLRSSGAVMIEHGFEQGAAVRRLFADAGLRDIRTERDIEARERVTIGVWRDN